MTALLLLLIAPSAFAAAPAAQAGFTSMLPMFIAFSVVMYFMILRPQKKRQQEQAQLLDNLSKGDEVATNGGLLGKIDKIKDNMLVLEVAANTRVIVQRNSVSQILPKGSLKSLLKAKD